MSDDKQPSSADDELEREIRDQRKFSLAEAIGRLAGPGMMKGVSPISGKQQAEAVIESFLKCHITDSSGVLSFVLLRHVRESDVLLNQFEQPLVALAGCVQQILESEYLLKEIVREADVEWGCVYGERPYFEKQGCPPHPDDPCTIESVRKALQQLAAELATGAA
jgi:hypothetical protein